MKIKLNLSLLAALLIINVNGPCFAGRVLDGTKVVSDEDAEWLAGEDVVSTSKFVRKTLKKPKELEEFDTLDLHGALLQTAGLRKIVDELLPSLPKLKILNLYFSGLNTKEDLELVASILQRFGNIQYVNIVGNPIAREVVSFVKEQDAKNGISDKFKKRVVFSFKTLLEDKFPEAERKDNLDWYNAHKAYYQMVH